MRRWRSDSRVYEPHRGNTTGELAPAGPCTVGAVQEVPYTATYVFSGPKPGGAAGE